MSEPTKEERVKALKKYWPHKRDMLIDTKIYLAIRRDIEHGPEVDEDAIKIWVEKYIPCHCDEAYTSRGLRAPDCPRHAWVDVPELKQFLHEVAGVTVKERK